MAGLRALPFSYWIKHRQYCFYNILQLSGVQCSSSYGGVLFWGWLRSAPFFYGIIKVPQRKRVWQHLPKRPWLSGMPTDWGSGGRKFESCLSDHQERRRINVYGVFLLFWYSCIKLLFSIRKRRKMWQNVWQHYTAPSMHFRAISSASSDACV